MADEHVEAVHTVAPALRIDVPGPLNIKEGKVGVVLEAGDRLVGEVGRLDVPERQNVDDAHYRPQPDERRSRTNGEGKVGVIDISLVIIVAALLSIQVSPFRVTSLENCKMQ